MHWLIVGAGGFLGSILRYWLSGLAQRWATTFPLGTLIVNVIGCLAIGAIWSLVEHRDWFTPETRTFLTVGIIGGFTTFSAFGYETFALLRNQQYGWAATNVLAQGTLGIGAVLAGWTLAKAIGGVP